MRPPVLVGDKVQLRPWRVQEASWYVQARDGAVLRWTSEPVELSAEEVVAALTKSDGDGRSVLFAMADPHTDEPMGNLPVRLADGIATLAYWLASEARGRGVTAEALSLVTTWLFETGLASVAELEIHPDNVASRRAAERAGFIEVGLRHSTAPYAGPEGQVALYRFAPGGEARIEAIIFDLGGVLVVEGEPVAHRRWEAVLGLAEGYLEAARAEAVGVGWAGGRTGAEIRADLAVRLGLDQAGLDEMLGDIASDTHLDPALLEFASRARARYRVGILANNGPGARSELNARFGLEDLVDAVVISAEEGLAKPEPEIYRLTAARLGVEPGACVFVDDRSENVSGAEAAGMRAIWHRETGSTLPALRAVLGMVEHDYRAAGGVVVSQDGAVLLLRRDSRDEWRLPKGHVEDGETDQEAALREVAEESGYDDLVIVADLGVAHLDFDAFVDDGPGHHVVRDEHYFLMTPVSLRLREREPGELKFEPRWVDLAEAGSLLTYDFERRWLNLGAVVPGWPAPISG